MAAYFIQRIARALLSLFIFVTLLFLIVAAVPGDVPIKCPTSEPSPEVVQGPQESAQPATVEPIGTPTPKATKTPKIKPPVEGLPLDDIQAYEEDVASELATQEAAQVEETQVGNNPEAVPTQEQPSPSTIFKDAEPSTIQLYLCWIGGLMRGDLGLSTSLRRPVTEALLDFAPRTLLLFVPSLLIGFSLGIWLGGLVSWRRGGYLEFFTSIAGVGFFTAFAPWLGFVLAFVFAFQLGWLPPLGIINPNEWLGTNIPVATIVKWLLITLLLLTLMIIGIWFNTRKLTKRRTSLRIIGILVVFGLTVAGWISAGWEMLALDILEHSILPMTTLVLLTFGGTMLMTRATMIDTLQDDHLVVAKAKGLPDRRVRIHHVVRLALIPVVTRFVLELPVVIISGFAVENVFQWGGLGEKLFKSANESDYLLLMGVLTVLAVSIMFAHLFVDFITPVLDPRLRKNWQKEPGD